MQVLVTNKLFFNQKYGGVNRYASCLLSKLLKKNLDFKVICPLYKNRYLKEINNIEKYGLYFPFYPSLKILENTNKIISKYLLKKIKTDIVHNLYYPEINQIHNKKNILTIHDTIHEKYKELYNYDYYEFRKKIVQNSDILICVSENTKNDVKEIYNIPDNKIFVTNHGFEHLDLVDPLNIENIENLKKPFILYVGGRYKYKNFNLLANAFAKSNKIKNNYNIVCFGGEKFSKNEKNYFNNLGILDKVIELKGNDRLLKSLYLKTSLLVSTSNYEGFGINILEAIYLDCPVLSNEIDIFKKLFDDIIDYYDFNNLDQLVGKLENILIANKIHANKNKRTSILNRYNWENCAKKTYDIYKLIC